MDLLYFQSSSILLFSYLVTSIFQSYEFFWLFFPLNQLLIFSYAANFSVPNSHGGSNLVLLILVCAIFNSTQGKLTKPMNLNVLLSIV